MGVNFLLGCVLCSQKRLAAKLKLRQNFELDWRIAGIFSCAEPWIFQPANFCNNSHSDHTSYRLLFFDRGLQVTSIDQGRLSGPCTYRQPACFDLRNLSEVPSIGQFLDTRRRVLQPGFNPFSKGLSEDLASLRKMAKDKDTTLSKEDRKAARKAEKKATKEKLVEDAGVKKPKSDKKEKKEKRKALAEKALNEVEGKKGKKVKKEESDEEDEEEAASDVDVKDAGDDNDSEEAEKATLSRPVGALVPFANPLADEKVSKKVFKSVKKGVCF